jgi:hypothetical protein
MEIFTHTLEWFLTAPCTIGKIIAGEDADLRFTCLKKLAAVSQSLGSDKKPVWREEPVPAVQGLENLRLMHIERSRLFGEMVKGDLDSIPDTECMQIYKTLGKSPGISIPHCR